MYADSVKDDGYLGSEQVGTLCKRDEKGQSCFNQFGPYSYRKRGRGDLPISITF